MSKAMEALPEKENLKGEQYRFGRKGSKSTPFDNFLYLSIISQIYSC
jgi:hypothetical protein